jgi:N4-gp56 family major capsid protein
MPKMNTTRQDIPAEVNNFYDRTLLTRAVSSFFHTRWAQIRDIPAGAGTKVIKFRRYGNLTAATTPLQEGVTPVGSKMSVTDITATVAQYGDYITVTDVLSYESEDPVLMEAAELMGDQTGDTLDQLTRDILCAGTGVIYSGTGNTATNQVATGDVITLANLDSAIATLKANNAKMITRQVDASTGYATSPIKAAFIGIVAPAIGVKIRTLAVAASMWTPVEKYASQAGVMEGEIGSYDCIRFVETNNAKVKSLAGESTEDVYCTLIFGANAYGITRVSGHAMQNIVKPLGSAGSADPLNQRATSGWKATFVAKILNEDFIQRIESAKV